MEKLSESRGFRWAKALSLRISHLLLRGGRCTGEDRRASVDKGGWSAKGGLRQSGANAMGQQSFGGERGGPESGGLC